MVVGALLIVSLILLILASIWRPNPPYPVHLGWLGLAFFMLAQVWPILTR